jgi:hypothetical protein
MERNEEKKKVRGVSITPMKLNWDSFSVRKERAPSVGPKAARSTAFLPLFGFRLSHVMQRVPGEVLLLCLISRAFLVKKQQATMGWLLGGCRSPQEGLPLAV